jgi:ABC-2 type transport system permease protein
MANNIFKYLHLYLIYTKYSFQVAFANRLTAGIFLFAKSIRILLFATFLWFLLQRTGGLGNYSQTQALFIYLSFNLIDTLSQLLFREVYRLREYILKGNLDFVLLKPVHPFSKILFGGTDGLDLIIAILLLLLIMFLGQSIFSANLLTWSAYLFLIFSSLVLATSFHILVIILGILTNSFTNIVLIYRDLSSMFRIPLNLYPEPLRILFTFVLPLGVMLSFPADAFFGLLAPNTLIITCLASLTLLICANLGWQYTIRHYQSTGS